MPHRDRAASTGLSPYLARTGPLMRVQGLLLLVHAPLAVRLPRVYHALCRRIFGMRVAISGTLSEEHPTLFVSNHASYLDITVLGSLIGGSFLAKAEVARWPLFGWLARLQRT